MTTTFIYNLGVRNLKSIWIVIFMVYIFKIKKGQYILSSIWLLSLLLLIYMWFFANSVLSESIVCNASPMTSSPRLNNGPVILAIDGATFVSDVAFQYEDEPKVVDVSPRQSISRWCNIWSLTALGLRVAVSKSYRNNIYITLYSCRMQLYKYSKRIH